MVAQDPGVKPDLVVSTRLSPDALHQAILKLSALDISEIPYRSVGEMDPTALIFSSQWEETCPAQALDILNLDMAITSVMAAELRAQRHESSGPEEVAEPEPELEGEACSTEAAQAVAEIQLMGAHMSAHSAAVIAECRGASAADHLVRLHLYADEAEVMQSEGGDACVPPLLALHV